MKILFNKIFYSTRLHKKYPEKEGKLKFYEIVKDLQDKNEGYLVLVRSGIFFVGVGKDAVILQNITTLKPVCLKEGICKCGIPVITFDKFIHNLKKENDIAVVIKVKYYYRYMDDAICLVKNKSEAKEILEKIGIYLKENLELELNKKTQIFKNRQGVNFCGYKINEYRMKIRNRGKKALKKKVKYLKNSIKNKKLTSKEARKYLAGHMGYINMADVYNLTNKIFYRDKP